MTALIQPVLQFGYRKSALERKRPSIRTELVIDNFAGGGGASMGIERALKRAVDIGINHDESALHMHEINHPATRHLCDSVWRVDPELVCRGQPVGLVWFSPDCRHFSRAKGKKPVSRKIRCLAWVVIRWARKVKPRLIMLENVREFQDWGPLVKDSTTGEEFPDPTRKGESFQRWVRELKRCGYYVEWKVLNAADYGAPTHRRRLFVIARCDGRPIKWPKQTHGAGRKRPWRTAAECIDWSLTCPSIFDRKKPLAEKTLRRIALGIKRYVLDNPKPFVVKVNHGGEHFRGQPLDKPMSTVTGAYGHALVAPNLVQTGYGERDGQARRVLDIEKPLGTVVSGGQKHGLVSALLTKHYGGTRPQIASSLDDPIGTITVQDHHSLTGAHLIKFRGDCNGVSADQPMPTITSGAGAERPAGCPHALGLAAASLIRMNHGEKQWTSADDPLGTITSQGNKYGLVYAFLAKYFGTAIGQECTGPIHTVTGKDRFGVVTVEVDGQTYAIADVGMRMLQPRELSRAQGFPEDYVLTGSKSNQVAKIGNSVPPQVVAALVRANW